MMFKSGVFVLVALLSFPSFGQRPTEVMTFEVEVSETFVNYDALTISRIGDTYILRNFETNNADFQHLAGTRANARAICALQDLNYVSYESRDFGMNCHSSMDCRSIRKRTSVIDGDSGLVVDMKTSSSALREVVCER